MRKVDAKVIEKIEKITLLELEKATGGKILFGTDTDIESISTSSKRRKI